MKAKKEFKIDANINSIEKGKPTEMKEPNFDKWANGSLDNPKFVFGNRYISEEEANRFAKEYAKKENKTIIKLLRQIKEHQMNYVQLARTTEVYKLADKAINLLTQKK